MDNFLVLGGCGYVGSHIVKSLSRERINLVVVDNLNTGLRNRISESTKFYNLDAKETSALNQIIIENQITSVIHLAAKKQARESMQNPLIYWDENIRVTLSLIKAVQNSSVRSILFSSSCSIYGNSGLTNLETKHNPQSTYARSKLVCEEILKDCRISVGYRLGILRYFNVIGAGDFDNSNDRATEAVLPSFINKVLSNEAINIFGNKFGTHDGTAIRDYVDVRDLAEAHLKVANFLNTGSNSQFECLVSTGNPKSVLEVAHEVILHAGRDAEIRYSESALGDPAEVWSKPDEQLINLGWEPVYTFSESVKSQVNEMLKNRFSAELGNK